MEKKTFKSKNYIKKYRKSIVEAMDIEKTKKLGFETSYFVFERSINKMEKSGDEAELLAENYLKEKGLLSDNYRTNKIIALNTIKIEADIIDFDNKVIYETKSRKTGKQAKQAVIKKWKVFEYDKKGSNYEHFKFRGIIVANYEDGKQVKGIVNLDNKILDDSKIKIEFEKHFAKLKEFQAIKKNSKNKKFDYKDNADKKDNKKT